MNVKIFQGRVHNSVQTQSDRTLVAAMKDSHWVLMASAAVRQVYLQYRSMLAFTVDSVSK